MTKAARKKQPEQVRRNLLNAAVEIAAERGLEFITTAEVAKRAGVSSGALFHHFPNKKLLIDAMISGLMKEMEDRLEEEVQNDAEPRGRFARAYLTAGYQYDYAGCDGRLMGSLIAALNREPELSKFWTGWREGQVKKYGEENDPVLAEIIRYAADGLWLETFTTPTADAEKRRLVVERLMEWTRQL